MLSTSSIVRRRHSLLAAAVIAASSMFTGIAEAQQFSYTNLNTTAVNTNSGATLSRALSINSSGDVVGYYQTSAGTSSRTFFTVPMGNTTVTPYQSGYTYFSGGSTGGSATGQLINDNNTYLANSGTPTAPGAGGYFTSPTATFSPIPNASNAYNGSSTVTYSNGNSYTITQTASLVNPIATVKSYVVGNQVYTATGFASVTSINHGVVYNYSGGTSYDIGGNPAGITYNSPTAGSLNNVGFSSLTGVSNNNIVVGSQGGANTGFNGTPADAIYGTSNGAGGYNFSDIGTGAGTNPSTVTIASLVPSGDTYYSSQATAISQNGQYVVGTYTYYIGTATTTRYTHSFELSNDSTIVDLGFISTGNNAYTNVLDATGVNDSGTVVGYGYTSSSSIHAFEYSNGLASDLNTIAPSSGAVYAVANGIDDSGDIVGYTTPTSTTSTASTSAFLLTATPEPTSLLFFTTAIGGTILSRRRRVASGHQPS